MITKKTTPGLIAASAGLILAMPASPALASGGGDDRVEVSSQGQCSGGARWQLKAKERDGGVEVEFEVDSGVSGQQWDYTLRGPGGVLASGTKTTTAPSGSFSVEARTGGSASDTFVGVATRGQQECRTGVNIGAADDKGSDDGPGDDTSTRDDGSKRVSEGTCSAGSQITLKVKRKSKTREAELEIDSNRKGQKWRYTIDRRGKAIKSGVKKTRGRSGSFSVEVKTRSKGRITATARRVAGGERCSI
ncbi:MAG: hypothetical protein R2720_01905 [Candidatus Nanopelagicales bacterium]